MSHLAERTNDDSEQHNDSDTGISSCFPLFDEDPPLLRRRSLSIWDISQSTTPMTTRCHIRYPLSCNAAPHHSTGGMRRIRSRSLGTALDDRIDDNSRYKMERPSESSVLLPRLQHDTDARKTSISSRQKAAGHQPMSLLDASSVNCETVVNDDVIVTDDNPIWLCFLYGLINGTIVLPVLMSFGSIIYRDDAFSQYMPILVKLTLISGIVHQLCFSTFSSLPFAVGQVQDAGLIFLSSMASNIVQYCRANGHDDQAMLATVTVGLSLSTALLGGSLVLIGHLRLGQYVQLLPTCVVGGYLAFIGWFCGMSGIGLMAGSSDVSPSVVVDQYVFILPGVLGGAFIYLAVTKLKHMATLPLSILAEIVIFYLVLWATGTTVSDATTEGWIRQMDAPPQWQHTWDYFRLNNVVWSAFPELFMTEIGMIFVVALSSSLDVAAIELELGRPLNYNHELKTVGLSNIMSGISGGYTGSYIFSQSIFSLRAGIRSRKAGFFLAGCEAFVLILPFPVLAYVPNFFFGSLLSMICIDLLFDWLWDVRKKISAVEYLICLSTFGLIQFLGIEYGIFAGVILYLLCKRLGFDVGAPKYTSQEGDECPEPLGT